MQLKRSYVKKNMQYIYISVIFSDFLKTFSVSSCSLLSKCLTPIPKFLCSLPSTARYLATIPPCWFLMGNMVLTQLGMGFFSKLRGSSSTLLYCERGSGSTAAVLPTLTSSLASSSSISSKRTLFWL